MDDLRNDILPIFENAEADLQDLDPEDSPKVAAIGLALEQVLSLVPDDMAALSQILTLCLEGLQGVYEKSLADPSRVVRVIAASLEAARQSLLSDELREAPLNAAMGEMRAALGKTPDDLSLIQSVEVGTDREVTLHDAAALLLQLDVSDIKELADVRDLLLRLASAGSLPDAAIEAVDSSMGRLDQIIRGETSAPNEVLAEAGRLLEVAMNAEYDAGHAVPEHAPQVVTEPARQSASSLLPEDADPALLAEFVTECEEYIGNAERSLLALETDPEDSEAINTVFRAFHTIKGTSGFLGLSLMTELANKAETLLSRMRDKEIRCAGGYADLALRSVDAVKDLISGVQSALAGEHAGSAVDIDDLLAVLDDPEANGVSAESYEIGYQAPRLGDILVAEGKARREDIEAIAGNSGAPLGEALVKSKAAPVADVAKALRTQKRLAGSEQVTDSSVRVRTDRLDSLIDTVGELVIAHSMVAQDQAVGIEANRDIAAKISHLGKIVRELQNLSMSMRMVPLKPTFQKMARLARDVARRSGRSIDFICEGEDTEIDRNMVNSINDPLVHLVRNAVDHGIESPDIRRAKGKPEKGTVKLVAYHSGGNVVVEIHDDGAGLDHDKIIEKAVSRGLIDSARGKPDSEVSGFIFEPGFSTAERITEVSGRGVGLDVVKKGVESLRGQIEVTSQPGQGCSFSIRLPLTLAVTDGLLIKVGTERFIIPTTCIDVSFRPQRESLHTLGAGGEFVMLRGEAVPLIRLHRLFGICGAVEDATDGLLISVGEQGRRCALLVDELLGQQHVVARSLGPGLGKTQGISGAAILGDGRVGLILDTAAVIALARRQTVPDTDGAAGLAA